MDSIKKLTDLFVKFPTVGSRTAGRFVMYLAKLPKEKIDELIFAMQELKNNTKLCKFCFNVFEDNNSLCSVCQNPGRNRKILCIVEKEADLNSIESTKRFNGIYFVLGNNMDNLRTSELKLRIENPEKFGIDGVGFSEIIVATNPTPEGRTSAVLAERVLKELPQFATLKITHLAKGLPIGGELEYADEETLESAFEGRK